MNIRNFIPAASRLIAQAVATGEPVPITKHNQPYAAVISAERLEQLQVAEDILQGLARLNERGAECVEYQSYADAVTPLIRAGRLNVRIPERETETTQ